MTIYYEVLNSKSSDKCHTKNVSFDFVLQMFSNRTLQYALKENAANFVLWNNIQKQQMNLFTRMPQV
jgi:hypothetical protein